MRSTRPYAMRSGCMTDHRTTWPGPSSGPASSATMIRTRHGKARHGKGHAQLGVSSGTLPTFMEGGETMLTLEDLEAMRQETGIAGRRGPGLPYDVRDDLKQVAMLPRFGTSPEEWARLRGVSVEYARALKRYAEQV